jgi:hypothetical protein
LTIVIDQQHIGGLVGKMFFNVQVVIPGDRLVQKCNHLLRIG